MRDYLLSILMQHTVSFLLKEVVISWTIRRRNCVPIIGFYWLTDIATKNMHVDKIKQHHFLLTEIANNCPGGLGMRLKQLPRRPGDETKTTAQEAWG